MPRRDRRCCRASDRAVPAVHDGFATRDHAGDRRTQVEEDAASGAPPAPSARELRGERLLLGVERLRLRLRIEIRLVQRESVLCEVLDAVRVDARSLRLAQRRGVRAANLADRGRANDDDVALLHRRSLLDLHLLDATGDRRRGSARCGRGSRSALRATSGSRAVAPSSRGRPRGRRT